MRPTYPNRRRPAMFAGTQPDTASSGRFALVVSRSPVNSVVVSRVVQDCGIRPVTSNPDNAIEIMRASLPLLVVMEVCQEPGVLTPLLSHISSIGNAPPVICLINGSQAKLPDYAFRAIAKMPITVDVFRPLIQACL